MTGKRIRGPLSCLILLAGILAYGQTDSLYYDKIFGNDWQKALKYLEDNNTWIKPAVNRFNIPYDELIAVVFPELVRYSALRDKMETSMLKTLYRNLGDDYANFSIGVFQVKPSFAEEIHERVFSGPDRDLKAIFKKKSSFNNIRLYRANVISDLENPETEINYLIAFYKICQKRFAREWPDKESRIKYLATAYNTGQMKSAKGIEMMSGKKFFNTKLFKTENYSYSDVSIYWYTNYSKTGK